MLNSSSISLSPASDHSLLLSFGNEISLENHQRVSALTRKLLASRSDFILNLHPAYCSVLISFDPLRVEFEEVESFIRAILARRDEAVAAARRIEIPVCYEGECSPDLQDVAAQNHLSREEAIEIHSTGVYCVCFIGFIPGFAYLGGLSPRLATPRLASPRTQVPAGSVAIGANQTGIYPLSTPGGWRLIGRTPLKLFSPEKEPFALLSLGDEVRFKRITLEEFEGLRYNKCQH
jgi:KipI family sensor histidine kinase inhibitor